MELWRQPSGHWFQYGRRHGSPFVVGHNNKHLPSTWSFIHARAMAIQEEADIASLLLTPATVGLQATNVSRHAMATTRRHRRSGTTDQICHQSSPTGVKSTRQVSFLSREHDGWLTLSCMKISLYRHAAGFRRRWHGAAIIAALPFRAIFIHVLY